MRRVAGPGVDVVVGDIFCSSSSAELVIGTAFTAIVNPIAGFLNSLVAAVFG